MTEQPCRVDGAMCQVRRPAGRPQTQDMVSITKQTALESRVQRNLPARFGGGYLEQGRDVPRRVPTLPQKHTAWLFWQQTTALSHLEHLPWWTR